MKKPNCILFLFVTLLIGIGACSEDSEPKLGKEINQQMLVQIVIDPDLLSVYEPESYTIQISMEVGIQNKNSIEVVNKEFESLLSHSLTEFFDEDVQKVYELQFPVRTDIHQIYYSYSINIILENRIQHGVSEYGTFLPTETIKTLTIAY